MEKTRSESGGAVLIVGGGLAGLACAVRLHEAGVACRVLEAGDAVGGRVRTDVVEGFRLDRGFQVLLTAYPAVRQELDLAALEPRAFAPGALVRHQGRFHSLDDPFRRPLAALGSAFGPIGSLGDKLRVASVRRRCRQGSVADQFAAPDQTTAEFLAAAGFGPSLTERFLRPFLGGIFLDPELQTSSRMFRFVFRMFSAGDAVLPARGMQAIPAQLAARLPGDTVSLQTPVAEVASGRVVLASGEVLTADRIVVATDGAQAADWLPGIRRPDWCPVTCLYFALPQAPLAEPRLILNGDGRGPINNLCFPTRVAPEYGPPGEDLASVTVVGPEGEDPAAVRAQVVAQLQEWFGAEAASWRHLRTYRIARALPRQEPGWLEPPARPVALGDGLFVAGDHVETASSNGALVAGYRAAAAVLGG